MWNQISYDSRSYEPSLCNSIHIEAWKNQDFNGVSRYRGATLAIPVRRSNQLCHEATDVGSWSFVGSNEPVRNEWNISYITSWNVSYITSHSFLTGSLEPTNDQLPTSVAL